MKKYLSLGLATMLACSLVGCGGQDDPKPTNEPGTEVADNEKGEVTGKIVIYTPMDDAQQTIVEEVWYNHYPDCEIEWLNDSVGTLMTKIETEASNPYADVLLGGLFESDDDSYHKNLDKYIPENVDELIVTDPNGYYTYLDIQVMALIVNTELEKQLGVEINSYEDLLDPKLKGYVIMPDPSASSSGFRQYTTMLRVCGDGEFGDDASWDFIKKLMGNLVTTNSSSTVYRSVMDGEYVAGLSWESIVEQLIKNGAENVKLIYPTEGNTACATGGAIVKNCPNRAAAEALIDLLGTQEMQEKRADANCVRGTNANFQYPGYPTDEEINMQPLDFPYIAEHKPELLDDWATLWEEYGNH